MPLSKVSLAIIKGFLAAAVTGFVGAFTYEAIQKRMKGSSNDKTLNRMLPKILQIHAFSQPFLAP